MQVTSSSLRGAKVSPEAGSVKLVMVQTVIVPLFHAWKWGEAILAQFVPESNTYPKKISTELKLVN